MANVGNHDVQLRDPDLLPDGLRERRVSSRQLGGEILANYNRYVKSVALPIIAPCLRWLLESEGVPPNDLYVHLFASDQNPPPVTPEGEWNKDTVFFAQVIERFLKSGGLAWMPPGEHEKSKLQLSKRQVHVHTFPGSPANYNNMMAYFGRELSRLTRWIDEKDAVYLEVTGGTPAMTSMLIVSGVEAFGERAHTLYVERGADRPYRIGIGRRFFARQAKAILRTQLTMHGYKSARETLERQGTLLVPDAERRQLVDLLLQYADRRLAFDFARAREALQRAQRYATGDLQAQIQYRLRELQPGEERERSSADLLAELIHSTRIKYEWGDYADFTQRLFRFQEAILRHLVEQMGLEYSDADGKYASGSWVKSIPGLTEFLEDYAFGSGQKGIDLDRYLNRISLMAIGEFFAEHAPEWAKARSLLKRIERISDVARLRNKGLAGHGFEGVGLEDLERAFGDGPDTIISHLEDIYAAVFEQVIGSSPYETINEVVVELLER